MGQSLKYKVILILLLSVVCSADWYGYSDLDMLGYNIKNFGTISGADLSLSGDVNVGGDIGVVGNYSSDSGGIELAGGSLVFTDRQADKGIDLSLFNVATQHYPVFKISPFTMESGAWTCGFVGSATTDNKSLAIIKSASNLGCMALGANGDAMRRFYLYANGKMEWSDGTNALDTNLYRDSANVLKTDDAFISATSITAGTYVSAENYIASSTSASIANPHYAIGTHGSIYGASIGGGAYASSTSIQFVNAADAVPLLYSEDVDKWVFFSDVIIESDDLNVGGAITGTSLTLGGGAITNATNTNWDLAYGWGDHSLEGYLTAEADTLDTVSDRGATTDQTLTAGGFTTAGIITDGTTSISGGNYTGVGNITGTGDYSSTGGIGVGNLTDAGIDEAVHIHATAPYLQLENADYEWRVGIDASPSSLMKFWSGANQVFACSTQGSFTIYTTNAGLRIDGANNTFIRVDRGGTTYKSEIRYQTAGSNNWVTGVADSGNFGDGTQFFIGQSEGGATPTIAITTAGVTSIGTPGTNETQISATGNVLLPAGSTAAGRYPIKFQNTTTPLTTPEAGVINFVNEKFCITNVATCRAVDRTSDVALTTVTVEDTTDETLLWTGVMNADSLRAGNVFKFHCDGDINSDSAGDIITIRIKVGGVTKATLAGAAKKLVDDHWHIDANATQRTLTDGATLGTRAIHIDMSIDEVEYSVVGVVNVDTEADMDVTVTAQWNNDDAGDILNMYQAFMEYKN